MLQYWSHLVRLRVVAVTLIASLLPGKYESMKVHTSSVFGKRDLGLPVHPYHGCTPGGKLTWPTKHCIFVVQRVRERERKRESCPLYGVKITTFTEYYYLQVVMCDGILIPCSCQPCRSAGI